MAIVMLYVVTLILQGIEFFQKVILFTSYSIYSLLFSLVDNNKIQDPILPEKSPALREAIHMTASLGGFLGRKCDGEPGTRTLWLGLQRLDDITEMWKITMSKLAPHLLRPPSGTQ